MAQSWRSNRSPGAARPVPPLDPAALERLALRYVERYATTRARLRDYLARKLRERGWEVDEAPAIEALVERIAGLGYVDDGAFASAKAAGLVRKGFGPRRIAASLNAAGVSEADAADATSATRANAWAAALTFARRKKIGPFALQAPDRQARERALAALVRAGHSFDNARRIVAALPGQTLDDDDR